MIRPASHDDMVKQVARHLKRRFYRNIRARAGDFPRPEAVTANGEGAFVPDLMVLARGPQLHILEVETRQSLREKSTREKWSAFARYASELQGKFTLVVPKGSGPQARAQLDDLRLEAVVWEL